MAHDDGRPLQVGDRAAELLQWLPPALVTDVLRCWRTENEQLAVKEGRVVYEVLSYQLHLRLEDSQGRLATLVRRETIRSLQDTSRAYQHRFWGDGDIVRRYRSSLGPAVDRFERASQQHLLVWMLSPMRAGETRVIESEQGFVNMFRHRQEWYEVLVRHRTQRAGCTIAFPPGRAPTSARVVRIGPRTLGERPIVYRLDCGTGGQWQLAWQLHSPAIGSTIRAEWTW